MKSPRIILVITIIVIALSGFVYIIFFKPDGNTLGVGVPQLGIREVNVGSATEQPVLEEDQKTLIEKVGELVILPKNELPSIATVTDVDKLSDQIFFAKARNGDKVLIYASEKWAVIYRPESNKIVEAASVDVVTSEEISPSPSASEAQTNDSSGSKTQRKVLIKEE